MATSCQEAETGGSDNYNPSSTPGKHQHMSLLSFLNKYKTGKDESPGAPTSSGGVDKQPEDFILDDLPQVQAPHNSSSRFRLWQPEQHCSQPSNSAAAVGTTPGLSTNFFCFLFGRTLTSLGGQIIRQCCVFSDGGVLAFCRS